MIFFLYGTDAYRINEKLNELKTGFKEQNKQASLNVVRLEGDKLSLDSFRQESLATSFFGDKKMLIISGLFKKNDAAQKKQRQELADFLAAKEKLIQNNLIFEEVFEDVKKFPLKDELFKLLKKQKYAWELNQLRGSELNSWLKKYCSDNKINLEPAAASELLLLVGDNLLQLSLELKKLTAYKKNQPIDKVAVIEMVKAKFDEDIFRLTDALGARNQKLALRLISDQLKSGTAPLGLLPMIQRQFRIIIKIKGQLNGAMRPNRMQLAKTLGLHEFVVSKAMAQADNFSEPQLKKIYTDLLSLEQQLKTSNKNPELLFDLFVTKNC